MTGRERWKNEETEMSRDARGEGVRGKFYECSGDVFSLTSDRERG